MIYLYDDAIRKDLERSFNPDNIGSPIVRVMDPEQGLKAIAHAEGDNLKFPLVLLTRHPDSPIDKTRWNFTRAHRGVAALLDNQTNNLYYEKAIPIEVNYDLTVLATNSADREELVRELIFKYTSMYFVTFELPYEYKRKVRFGITIDMDREVSSKSGTLDYLNTGTLYQTIIPLRCEGCVLVSYTPAKLQRTIYDLCLTDPTGEEP